MEAGRAGLDTVTAACFDNALATVALGRARTSALVTERDREITAWHEAGHTIAALLLPEADDPVQVSITPRGPAGGVTWMSGNDDIFLSRTAALARLTVALAGQAAEQHLLGGEYTSGAHGDLTAATRLATAMATQYGMTDLGLAVHPAEQITSGGQVEAAVTAQVNRMLEAARQAAYDLLDEHRDTLAALAGALLEAETLSLAEVRAVHAAVTGHGIAPMPVAAP